MADIFREQVPGRSMGEKSSVRARGVVYLGQLCNLERFYVYPSILTLGLSEICLSRKKTKNVNLFLNEAQDKGQLLIYFKEYFKNVVSHN